jgi:hypothetical protein
MRKTNKQARIGSFAYRCLAAKLACFECLAARAFAGAAFTRVPLSRALFRPEFLSRLRLLRKLLTLAPFPAEGRLA